MKLHELSHCMVINASSIESMLSGFAKTSNSELCSKQQVRQLQRIHAVMSPVAYGSQQVFLSKQIC